MNKNNDSELVTKGFYKNHLNQELKKLKKEVTSDLIDFMDNSVVPLLKSMDQKLDNLNDLVNNHEHRIDKLEVKVASLKN